MHRESRAECSHATWRSGSSAKIHRQVRLDGSAALVAVADGPWLVVGFVVVCQALTPLGLALARSPRTRAERADSGAPDSESDPATARPDLGRTTRVRLARSRRRRG
ncbi:hypothetical protein ACIRA2_35140 [Streptomyces griseoviridis]